MGFKDRDDPLTTLRREVERLVEEVGKGVFGGASGPAQAGRETPSAKTAFAPPIDLNEDEDALELRADLPGWSQDEVAIEAEAGGVLLRGTPANGGGVAERYHLKERARRPFERRVTLPAEVDVTQAAARFERGVLTLRLPKTQAAKRQKIEIKEG